MPECSTCLVNGSSHVHTNLRLWSTTCKNIPKVKEESVAKPQLLRRCQLASTTVQYAKCVICRIPSNVEGQESYTRQSSQWNHGTNFFFVFPEFLLRHPSVYADCERWIYSIHSLRQRWRSRGTLLTTQPASPWPLPNDGCCQALSNKTFPPLWMSHHPPKLWRQEAKQSRTKQEHWYSFSWWRLTTGRRRIEGECISPQ